jgi:hypothetical protein
MDGTRPFRLNAAPIEAASSYTGPGTCTPCHHDADDRLGLSVGERLIHQCERCDAPFDALSDDIGMECSRYDPPSTFPSLDKKRNLGFSCIRGGTTRRPDQDTEYGVLRWQDAV